LEFRTPFFFQELDHIESPRNILIYFFLNFLPDLFRALKDTFREIKLSRVRFVHPSLIAGEVDGVLALKGSNLVVEAMLSTIKDFDMALAGLLPGRFCIYKMASFCLIGSTYGPFDPDIAFNIIFPRLKFFLICLTIFNNDTNSRYDTESCTGKGSYQGTFWTQECTNSNTIANSTSYCKQSWR
jgi:hypothetical protein